MICPHWRTHASTTLLLYLLGSKDQLYLSIYLKVGAEEGIYTLNLNELHENAMDLLYPRRTVWMFVIKDILMTLSGKGLLDS